MARSFPNRIRNNVNYKFAAARPVSCTRVRVTPPPCVCVRVRNITARTRAAEPATLLQQPSTPYFSASTELSRPLAAAGFGPARRRAPAVAPPRTVVSRARFFRPASISRAPPLVSLGKFICEPFDAPDRTVLSLARLRRTRSTITHYHNINVDDGRAVVQTHFGTVQSRNCSARNALPQRIPSSSIARKRYTKSKLS